jgi:hypothetical protein
MNTYATDFRQYAETVSKTSGDISRVPGGKFVPEGRHHPPHGDLIPGKDGFVPNVRSAATSSTGRRRDRLNRGKSNRKGSDCADWRRRDSDRASLLQKPKSQPASIIIRPPIEKDMNIPPSLVYLLVLISATPAEIQELVDHYNTKKYDDGDPHKCTPNKPCKCHLMRKTDTGCLDFTSGLHIVAQNTKTGNVIVPSWHPDMMNCICDFDKRIVQQKTVQDYIRKQSPPHKDGKQLYVILNYFGGDPCGRGTIKSSMQYIRGKVDPPDFHAVGIRGKLSKATPNALVKAGRLAAMREMTEETDGVFVGTEAHQNQMDIVYDFRQDNLKSQDTLRGIVFGMTVRPDELLNKKRVFQLD